MMSSTSNGEMMVMKKKKNEVPIGFRFRPTDEELLVHYLLPKSLSHPLPSSVIPDHHDNVFLSDPWSFPGNLREKRYFFWQRKVSKSSRIMATTSGFWKAIGKGKPVISHGTQNDVVGCRKSWAFYQFSNNILPHHHGQCYYHKTHWFMHEFQLLETLNSMVGEEVQDQWVVCRIFQRKMRHKNKVKVMLENEGVINHEAPCYIDLRVENNFELGPPPPTQPSSPCSIAD